MAESHVYKTLDGLYCVAYDPSVATAHTIRRVIELSAYRRYLIDNATGTWPVRGGGERYRMYVRTSERRKGLVVYEEIE